MEKANLGLVQKDDKLSGGFTVLTTEKLKKINGGENLPNKDCTNRSSACNTTNTSTCTNWGDRNCATSLNKDFCQNHA